MSAGFSIADEIFFWATNGAVEAYVEALAAQAAERLGPDDPLVAFFQGEREEFFDGQGGSPRRVAGRRDGSGSLLEILSAAAEHLLREGGFSEYGREWIVSVTAGLRAKIAQQDSSLP